MWDLGTIIARNNEAAGVATKRRPMPKPAGPDFMFKNPYDNVWLLAPLTTAAKDYLREHGCPNAVYWNNQTAVVPAKKVDATARVLRMKGFDVI